MFRQLQSGIHTLVDTVTNSQQIENERFNQLTRIMSSQYPSTSRANCVNPITLGATIDVHQMPALGFPRETQVQSMAFEAVPSLTSPMRGHDITIPPEDIPPERRAIFTLPGGEEIVFDKTIPLCDPPAVHYSSAISQLFIDWHNSDLVRLNGHGIPIKCWDVLYQKHGNGQWGSNRNEWGNWKVCLPHPRTQPCD